METRIWLRKFILLLNIKALISHSSVSLTKNLNYSKLSEHKQKVSRRKMKLFISLVLATIFVVSIENMMAKYLLVDLDQESKVGRGPRVPLPSSKNILLLWESVVRFHILTFYNTFPWYICYYVTLISFSSKQVYVVLAFWLILVTRWLACVRNCLMLDKVGWNDRLSLFLISSFSIIYLFRD